MIKIKSVIVIIQKLPNYKLTQKHSYMYTGIELTKHKTPKK